MVARRTSKERVIGVRGDEHGQKLEERSTCPPPAGGCRIRFHCDRSVVRGIRDGILGSYSVLRSEQLRVSL